ncbi:MAG TPA: DNA gyrase inhibitor YacG [Isosphaeraceae bacterium]|jgi:endogenous inhibitor of DNA gyrase (YacG/DUF329 family)|nr:DNA gyrase inhibitor YacG [Isosphaeraceae bacterium]
MIRGRCPICSKSYEIASVDALPSFPFCTDRCRMIDLGRWIDGKYAIPGSAKDQKQQEEGDESSADDVE